MTFEFQSALRLIKYLDETFPGTQSLIVGGAVRDHILGIESNDVDIATNIPLHELERAGFNIKDITKTTVNAQPVSTIKFQGSVYEIASFRSDSSGVEGRANNVATIVNTFEEDSARRDITINAIGLDSNCNLVDPQGGAEDLRNGIVRAVGDANLRFAEDATRILRVIRFASTFGFAIEPDTWVTVWNNKHRLANREEISPESISKEIFKVAKSGPALASFIDLLCLGGMIDTVLPEFGALHGFTHDPAHHPEGGSTVIGHILECLRASKSSDPVVNIAILFHDLGKAVTRGIKANGHSSYHGHEGAGVPIAQRIFDRLKFCELSSHDRENILFAVKRHMLLHDPDRLSFKKKVELVLNPGWEVLKLTSLADEASRGPDLFNAEKFEEKIKALEDRVHNIAASSDDLRIRLKDFIDGNRVLEWFPETASDKTILGRVIPACKDFLVSEISEGRTPAEADVKNFVRNFITNAIH